MAIYTVDAFVVIVLAFDAAIVGCANDVITAEAYVAVILLFVYVAATELYCIPVVNHDVAVLLLPIVILLLIPTPPVTTKAPVVDVVDAVVLDRVTIPPALIAPLTPTPPVITNVPVVVVVDAVFAVNVTALDAPNVVIPDSAPFNVKLVNAPILVIFGWAAVVKVPPKLVAFNAPLTPTPPVTTNVPVVVVVEAVPAVIVTAPEAPSVVTPDNVPAKVKLVSVPTLVIAVWAAVVKVPLNEVAVNVLIFVIFLDASRTNVLDASAVPGPVVKSL